MGEIYNYKTGRLYIKYRDTITFDLNIRTPITVIDGGSATGKTLLANYLKNEYKASNVVVFNDTFSVSDLTQIHNCLIIIDRCDLIVTSDIADYISTDRSNHYLLFSRTGLPLGISPNYYGEFVHNGDKVSIYYEFNELGWF